jgi:hypothetical protein
MGDEIFDPENEREVALEPLPPAMDEADYIRAVAQLPIPTDEQIIDFVSFVAGAKSWYKHLPCRPPGAPMAFYLDPNAGCDRFRRWGHQAIFRDRTHATEQLHHTWMTTHEYRTRFGYLAFCCELGTGIFMDETLADGMATLDPNVFAPLIEGKPGTLSSVPKRVVDAGTCWVTATVHANMDAQGLSRRWHNATSQAMPYPGEDLEHSGGQWTKIASLCEELFRRTRERGLRRPLTLSNVLPRIGSVFTQTVMRWRVAALESELTGMIEKQRKEEHRRIKTAVENMLAFVYRMTAHSGPPQRSRW